MEQVVPGQELLALIQLHYPKAGRGRRLYPMTSMLRIHLMQNWFGLSDAGMEKALYEIVPVKKRTLRLAFCGSVAGLFRPSLAGQSNGGMRAMRLGKSSDTSSDSEVYEISNELQDVFPEVESIYREVDLEIFWVFRCLADSIERKTTRRYSRKENVLYLELQSRSFLPNEQG